MSAADWLHFLGLVYVLFGLASTINPQALKGAIDELPLNKAAMLNISLISLMLGSAILATHSGWNSVENILVSIIGWGALIKGFTYLAYPNSINHFKPMVSNLSQIRTVGFFSVLLGVYFLAVAAGWL